MADEVVGDGVAASLADGGNGTEGCGIGGVGGGDPYGNTGDGHRRCEVLLSRPEGKCILVECALANDHVGIALCRLYLGLMSTLCLAILILFLTRFLSIV